MCNAIWRIWSRCNRHRQKERQRATRNEKKNRTVCFSYCLELGTRLRKTTRQTDRRNNLVQRQCWNSKIEVQLFSDETIKWTHNACIYAQHTETHTHDFRYDGFFKKFWQCRYAICESASISQNVDTNLKVATISGIEYANRRITSKFKQQRAYRFPIVFEFHFFFSQQFYCVPIYFVFFLENDSSIEI